jgi:hypothetical protein
MTDIDDDNDSSAVDKFELYLEGVYEHEIPDPKTHVYIPRDVARAVLHLAKKGQHKGRGRRGVRRSELEKWCQELVIDEAEDCKVDLQKADTNLSDAEAKRQAAAKASRRLHDKYGMNLAAETIRLRMKHQPK